MRARDRRKVLHELRRQCRAKGLEFILDASAGKGSHQSVIIRDPDDGTHVRFVVPGHRELSPGVQRNLLHYVAGLKPRLPLAGLVHQILEQAFDDA